MAHKTITISEDAYNSLSKLKKNNESFTDVILRITAFDNRKNNLLSYIKKKKINNDLANSINDSYNERDSIELRNF